MDLLKLNDKDEEIVCMSNDEIDNIIGGFAIVSDPIYKLTNEEEKGLKAAGYNLKKTNSGNYRITNEDGKMASPSEIQTLCKVINRCTKKDKSIWSYIFDMD